MKKPLKFAAFGLGALALFATTYFSIFAVMGVPMEEAPVTGPVMSKPTPEPQPIKASTKRASDVLGAFVLPAGVQAETLRTLKSELYDQLQQVRDTRELLKQKEQGVADREAELSNRFDELLGLRASLDEYHLELVARAEELEHEGSVRDQKRAARLTDMSTYLVEGEASHAAALLGSMNPNDAARVLDALEPERAGEILRAMTPEASRRVWEAGLAQDG